MVLDRTKKYSLERMSGQEALTAIADFIDDPTINLKIASYPILSIASIEHRDKPRDIHMVARSIGITLLRIEFGSGDEPVIDFALQVLGQE